VVRAQAVQQPLRKGHPAQPPWAKARKRTDECSLSAPFPEKHARGAVPHPRFTATVSAMEPASSVRSALAAMVAARTAEASHGAVPTRGQPDAQQQASASARLQNCHPHACVQAVLVAALVL
jgi:hypothetical protein